MSSGRQDWYSAESEREDAEERIAAKSPERLVHNIHQLARIAESFVLLRDLIGQPVPTHDAKIVRLMAQYSMKDIEEMGAALKPKTK